MSLVVACMMLSRGTFVRGYEALFLVAHLLLLWLRDCFGYRTYFQNSHIESCFFKTKSSHGKMKCPIRVAGNRERVKQFLRIARFAVVQ